MRGTAAALLVATAVVAASCGGGGGGAASSNAIDPAGARAFVDAAPDLASRPGTQPITVIEGAFADRIAISGLAFAPGRSPHLRGRVRSVVDVSDLLLLEVRADFFDTAGRRLGSRRLIVRDGDAGSRLGGDVRFDLTPQSALARGARKVVLSIPQLVNE